MLPYGQRGKISLPAREPGHCTWCGEPVKPPRRSWCSQKCVDEWRERGDWNHIREKIGKRDKVCQICGGCRLERSYDVVPGARFGNLQNIRGIDHVAPYTVVRPGGWEVDHIVAVADGGTDDPANLRLLCSPCHKDVTRAQRRAAALARRAQLPLLG